MLFNRFKTRFSRVYSSDDEHQYRFSVFQENIAHARHLNAQPREFGHTAMYGVTKFSDWTQQEREDNLFGNIANVDEMPPGEYFCPDSYPCFPSTTPPTDFDWRDDSRSPITAVKNQGQCGGCWAFATAQTVEASWAIAGNPPVGGADPNLSVEQLLGCDSGSFGCNGGFLFQALLWMWQSSVNGSGLVSDSADPYTCANGCAGPVGCPPLETQPKATIKATCSCAYDVNGTNYEAQMTAALHQYGPLAVTVDADTWYSYSGGIVRQHCSASSPADHAVQVTGYGIDTSTHPGVEYWWVRNSWGPDWGEDGYIQLFRGDNVCGVANNVSYAFS